MDLGKLNKLYATTNGKIVLDFLSTYQKNMSETSAPNVYAGISRVISEWEVRQVLKELADLGAGQFKIGRKGHFSRLIWSENLTEVCASIDVKKPYVGTTSTAGLTLTIPNLTAKNAARVSEFVATL